MTDWSRPLIKPLLLAAQTVLEAIDFGGNTYQAGIGGAPDCLPPYLIITSVTGGTSSTGGTFQAPEADGLDRLQLTAIAPTALGALAILDKARVAFTTPALDAALTTRRVMLVTLDLHRGQVREDRGLPDPLFSVLDQYEIMTTPGV